MNLNLDESKENKNAPSYLISTHCVQSYEKTTKRTNTQEEVLLC
jgi:hypothetical protein